MIFNDDDTYDSMSEEEMEALEHVAMHRHVNEDEEDQVFCDNDSSPSLMVSKVLTLQHHQEEDPMVPHLPHQGRHQWTVRQGHHRWR